MHVVRLLLWCSVFLVVAGFPLKACPRVLNFLVRSQGKFRNASAIGFFFDSGVNVLYTFLGVLQQYPADKETVPFLVFMRVRDSILETLKQCR